MQWLGSTNYFLGVSSRTNMNPACASTSNKATT